MLKHNENKLPELTEFSSLKKYSWKQKLSIYVVDLLLYSTIKLIGSTVKYEVEGWKDSDIPGWESFEIAYKNRPATIMAFWHNRIFLMTHYWCGEGGNIMVSKSFDGEYISRTAQRFGYGVIRGSSSRGGSRALKQMSRLLKRGNTMVFTIDGPKGPRYKVKPGALLLAKQTGVPIVPISVEAKKFWTIKSWDKLQIPKPFTKARVFVSEPIFIAEDSDAEILRKKRKELQRKLDELVSRGKQWRESKN